MKHHPVLALMNDGTPLHWLGWEAAVTLQYKGLVAWTPVDDETTFYGGMSRMTGTQSHIEVPSIIAIKGDFKRKNSTPALTNQNLFKRDLLTCSYCGKHFPEEKLTRDHIVPVSKGGKDTWMNVTAACRKCNNLKDNQTLEQCGLELLWAPYVPNRAEALILQNRKILFDQAAYIANYVSEHSRVRRYLKEHCNIEV